MASCVRYICTKNHQNLIIGFHVTVENVGDFFETVSGTLRGWGRGVSYPGPRDVWGPHRRAELRQNVPFEKEKFKNFLPRGAMRECFPGPRCGSRRACTVYAALMRTLQVDS